MMEKELLFPHCRSSRSFMMRFILLWVSIMRLSLMRHTAARQVKSALKLKAALADVSDALQEYAELEEKAVEEIEKNDPLVQEMLSQGKHQNMSFFAFTATPKGKTLEILENRSRMALSIHSIFTLCDRQSRKDLFLMCLPTIPLTKCAIS